MRGTAVVLVVAVSLASCAQVSVNTGTTCVHPKPHGNVEVPKGLGVPSVPKIVSKAKDKLKSTQLGKTE